MIEFGALKWGRYALYCVSRWWNLCQRWYRKSKWICRKSCRNSKANQEQTIVLALSCMLFQKLHSECKSKLKDFLSRNWVSCFESMSMKGGSRLWAFWWDLLLPRNERASYFCDWMSFRLVDTLGLITRVPRCRTPAWAGNVCSSLFYFQFRDDQTMSGICNSICNPKEKNLLSISKFFPGFRMRSLVCGLWELSDLLHSISNYLIFSNSKNAINPQKKHTAFEKKEWLLIARLWIFLIIYWTRKDFFSL